MLKSGLKFKKFPFAGDIELLGRSLTTCRILIFIRDLCEVSAKLCWISTQGLAWTCMVDMTICMMHMISVGGGNQHYWIAELSSMLVCRMQGPVFQTPILQNIFYN